MRTLARERIAPRAAEIDASHEFPWDVVELFRDQGIFGLLFDEEHGGTGTGTLLALIAIEEVSKVCATSGLILAVQELGSLGIKLGGHGRAARAAGCRASRRARCSRRTRSPRPGRAPTRRRCGRPRACDGDDVRPRRLEALHHERRRRRALHGLREDRPRGRARGISAFLVEADAPGFEVARLEEKMGIAGSTTGELVFDGLPDPRVEPARRGGHRLQARDADPRPLAAGRRGSGARDRPGRDRLRARVRADARDDGQADRASTS